MRRHRRLTLTVYLWLMRMGEPVAAWLLTVSSHGDHIGHPFI
jgi:hypothetical protein